jgi:peptidyl-prolyl cis-trans isomerase A (cyclophilin A)
MKLKTIAATLGGAVICSTPGDAQPAQPAAAPALRSPTAAALAAQGPDSFDITLYTTKGPVTARVRRAWAPRGADRVFHAVRARYYDGVRFYRVIPGFMAQFGFNGNPAVSRAWAAHEMPDDPVRQTNARGMLTFASRGPNTRTVQLFINTAANRNLDALGFAPVGQVLAGMAAVEALYAGYGEGAPRGPGPDQELIALQGNAYLGKSFPKLDAIDSARVVQLWPRIRPGP